ncbi:hypothetical protein BDK51DRAFT_33160 [Blyttiomyces helicus]|uniref:Uncharacterized protein n=1 Tax=Blyttiomyces helicus TaxID=388810 RepID=A0A4P9WM33_9FUNG|nr:hypothetical protein BDK51DRAFT_33160 [Blyttiomyces helicus]|eukprot:RKO94119.1 hypothetical protein BDK51DRAFT_33160 [Blyttiomyces helicus]
MSEEGESELGEGESELGEEESELRERESELIGVGRHEKRNRGGQRRKSKEGTLQNRICHPLITSPEPSATSRPPVQAVCYKGDEPCPRQEWNGEKYAPNEKTHKGNFRGDQTRPDQTRPNGCGRKRLLYGLLRSGVGDAMGSRCGRFSHMSDVPRCDGIWVLDKTRREAGQCVAVVDMNEKCATLVAWRRSCMGDDNLKENPNNNANRKISGKLSRNLDKKNCSNF